MPPAAAETPRPDLERFPFRTRAFGLDLQVRFPVPGLAPGGSFGGAPPTVLEHGAVEPGTARAVRRQRLSEGRAVGGVLQSSIDFREGHGYELFAQEYGRYLVSPDATRIVCAPADGEPWRWQRYLVGQVLPFASVLSGHEVLHASAVEVEGRALAVAGASRSGKTSLALRLAQRGATFMTDDVVVLDAAPNRLCVHPGAGVASLRAEEAARMSRSELADLGQVLGTEDDALRIVIRRKEDPCPLGALFIIDRVLDGTVAVDVADPDPRILLGSTFNFVLRNARRLATQFDVCARLAREVPIFRVRIPLRAPAEEVADEILRRYKQVLRR